MIDDINLTLILLAALVGVASPGPSTLAIAGTSMTSGRRYGLALAAGVMTGSWSWSIAAALGLSAIMFANAWIFEVMRYLGAGYLLYLAYKSTRSALNRSQNSAPGMAVKSYRSAYAKGLAMHLTNPKAILFFGSLFSIGVPKGTSIESLAIVVLAVGLQSTIVFHGYALLFSSPPIAQTYVKLRRWFEAIFALVFGIAGLKILTVRID